MAKNHTSHYTTQVQIAVPTGLSDPICRLLHDCAALKVVGETITDGSRLLEDIRITRPDILLLDMTLPRLDAPSLFKTLGDRPYPPYVVVTAPSYASHLAQAEQHQVVRGTLLNRLTTSPLLLPVLNGIAEGHTYFTPEASLNLRFSDLTLGDTILLALMAVGMQVYDLACGLDCSTNVIYTTQSQLRKKLGVQTNEQAILAGIRRKLVGVLTEPGDRAFKEIA